MKKYLLPLIVTLLTLLPTLASAQSNERMLIYSKSGEIFPYRVEHVDSIKFLNNEQDLTLNPTVIAHPDGKTGWMKLKVGSVGSDVKRLKVIIPETFMIAQMSDAECMRLFNPDLAARMGLSVFEVEAEKEYDLSQMQQGYAYTAVFLPYDELGCPGNVKRVDFTVSKGPLAGNPQVEVKFSNITQTGYTFTVTPNEDVAGYYLLNDETNSDSRNQIMQMMRIPDLHHYVVLYGKDFATQDAYTGVHEMTMDNFKPGVEYTLFIVIKDKNGQLSDVYTNFTVTTAKKGTSETATVKVEVKDITETSATVVSTPDANTSVYRETIIEKSKFSEQEMLSYLKDTPDNLSLPYHSETFTQQWNELKSGTAYYAVALAKNADGKWGPLTKVEFTTKKKP